MKNIFFSVILTTALFWLVVFGGFSLYKTYTNNMCEYAYEINQVASCSCGGEKLPHHLLCDQLQIKRTDFDVKKYEENLRRSPEFAFVKVFPYFPSTLMVEYILRQPIALIESYKNVGIDENGVCFYIYPFFEEKRMPRLIFGAPSSFLIESIQSEIYQQRFLCLGIFFVKKFSDIAKMHSLRLEQIDISLLGEKNYFRKEITCIFSQVLSSDVHFYVRMHPKNCHYIIDVLEKKFGTLIKAFPSGAIFDGRFGQQILLAEPT